MRSENKAPSLKKETDILIIGGGLAGVSAATSLSNKGYDVVLISAHARHPPDFRAEKIGIEQMQLFERIGLGDAVHEQMTSFDGCWTYRFGGMVKRSEKTEYASSYPGLVNSLRDAMPKAVHSLVGRVDTILTGRDRQTVTLSDGKSISARLLIVATGLGDALRRKLGVERDVFSPSHSLCCGFDLERSASDFPFPSLVWVGERPKDRLSYLTLFPIGDVMRANLFVYRTASEEWTKRFCQHPTERLHEFIPELPRLFGEMAVKTPVTPRPIDLLRVRKHERDGVVLIGDAFSVVCPITGTGIDKALTDVDRLSNHHVPQWFSSSGMGYEKLSNFYDDPVKAARDQSALKMSLNAKSSRVNTSIYWRLRRLYSNAVGRARFAFC